MVAPHLMASLARPLLLFVLLCLGAAATVWALPDRGMSSALDDVPEDERVGGATLEGGPSPRGEDVALVLGGIGGSPKGEVSD